LREGPALKSRDESHAVRKSAGRLLKVCPTGGRPGSNACGEGVTLCEAGSPPLKWWEEVIN